MHSVIPHPALCSIITSRWVILVRRTGCLKGVWTCPWLILFNIFSNLTLIAWPQLSTLFLKIHFLNCLRAVLLRWLHTLPAGPLMMVFCWWGTSLTQINSSAHLHCLLPLSLFPARANAPDTHPFSLKWSQLSLCVRTCHWQQKSKAKKDMRQRIRQTAVLELGGGGSHYSRHVRTGAGSVSGAS